MILHLFSALVRSHLEYCVLSSPVEKRHRHTGETPAKHHDDGLELLSCKERLRKLGLFSLEKRRFRAGEVVRVLVCISLMCTNI